MKKYGLCDTWADLRLLRDIIDVSIQNNERIMQNRYQDELRVLQDFDHLIENLNRTREQIHAVLDDEKKGREESVRNKILHMNLTMNEVLDPHFHRMLERYKSQCDRRSYVKPSDSANDIMRKMDQLLRMMEKAVNELNHSFIPAGMSNVIGSVIKPYRKSKYMDIVRIWDACLSCADSLVHMTDIEEELQCCELVYENRLKQEQEEKEKKVENISHKTRLEIHSNYLKFKECIEQFNAGSFLAESRGGAVVFGECQYKDVNTQVLDKETVLSIKPVKLYDDMLALPVSVDMVDESISFKKNSNRSMGDIFSSLTTEMLSADISCELNLVDVKGLGSTYSQLRSISEFDSVNIWTTDKMLEQGLLQLENYIVETYEKCLKDQYRTIEEYNEHTGATNRRKYLIIDDIVDNLPQKYFQQILRIINNGKNAGVCVLFSYHDEGTCTNRQFQEFLSDVRAFEVQLEGDKILMEKNMILKMKTAVNPEKLTHICSELLVKNTQSTIVSIGTALPNEENWQSSSSEKEILIPFGIDENKNEAILSISAERPYGLIIGDVRVGKSSLIHTIIFQVLSRYSPEEVRIAIGDFKDGADFNVYAKANLPSIDVVINDEDPDAMLSFLKYYVQEMQERQRTFEKLEELTGRIVSKYEYYRQINRENQNVLPPMPRILILIDEFQSLFDGSASAVLMTELVRKGATYGIHVVLSSQRAISDNPRNGFSMSLKDYFTSRFVFKTPQAAARSMLSERCADTGRENSGIQQAPMLKKGQVIYNSYMGQNEVDNVCVQCYYASPKMITQFIQVILAVNGKGNSILLKRKAHSQVRPKKNSGMIMLGTSVALHKDSPNADTDVIFDNTEVSIRPEKIKNILLTGADERILDSVMDSITAWRMEEKQNACQIHIFGTRQFYLPVESETVKIIYHESVEEQIEEIQKQAKDEPTEYYINVFCEPDQYTEWTQALGAIRTSPAVEAFKTVLKRTSFSKGFTVLYGKSYKNIRSTMSYALGEMPIHITAVGDMENVKYSMSEHIRFSVCEFDIPSSGAIKAYYYNKDTEKAGKVILYLPDRNEL